MRKYNYITEPENWIQIPFRMVSTMIVRVLAKTIITPNQVTLARTVVVIVSLYYFSLGDPGSLIIAVILFYIFEILDHVDGDLARYTKNFSRMGPKLEQFVDTWSSRPSSVFGLCVAIGIYRYEGTLLGIWLYLITALGRLFWLEYRDYFGWEHQSKSDDKQYQGVFGVRSKKEAIMSSFQILYIWNNTFLLMGALFYLPVQSFFGMNSLIIGFVIVAVLNNLPWIFIVLKGFLDIQKSIKD